jgi:hypothetical protein
MIGWCLVAMSLATAPKATVVGDWSMRSPAVTMRVTVAPNGELEGVILLGHNNADVGKRALQAAPRTGGGWAGSLTMTDTGTSKAVVTWDGANKLVLKLSMFLFSQTLEMERVK